MAADQFRIPQKHAQSMLSFVYENWRTLFGSKAFVLEQLQRDDVEVADTGPVRATANQVESIDTALPPEELQLLVGNRAVRMARALSGWYVFWTTLLPAGLYFFLVLPWCAARGWKSLLAGFAIYFVGFYLLAAIGLFVQLPFVWLFTRFLMRVNGVPIPINEQGTLQQNATDELLTDGTESSAPKKTPAWLGVTKRLFPHPLFAGCVSFACLLLTILFAGGAIAARMWPMGMASVFFLAASYATAAAAFSGNHQHQDGDEQQFQTAKPTFAVFVLLISGYSWLLTIGMHIFHAFFNNGPASVKYFITLGIALSSTVFMHLYGERIIRQHFARMGGRNLVLTTQQVLYVVIFVICCGIYLAWLAA
jgi:hypothetical protein